MQVVLSKTICFKLTYTSIKNILTYLFDNKDEKFNIKQYQYNETFSCSIINVTLLSKA